MEQNTKKSFFETIPSKTSFILGAVSAILVLGTIGFVSLGLYVMNGGSVDSARIANAPTPTNPSAIPPTQPAPSAPTSAPAPVSDDEYVRGNPNAEITLIEYSDFECPFCNRFHPTMKQVMDEYGDQVRWIHRHFPLSFHQNAESAAEAAECAGEQGNFWEYADELYANQSDLNQATYTRIAQNLGLNTTTFQDCLDSDRHIQKIRAQAQEGASAGVTGTPGTFVVDSDGNAELIKGALPYASVKQIIDQMLAS